MPLGLSETIRAAFARILGAAGAGVKGGFVVFDDGKELEYVQFSVEPAGLMHMWPTEYVEVPVDRVTDLLRTLSFTKVDANRTPAERTYAVEDDGVYAMFGRDTALAEKFTLKAFEQLFGRTPAKLR